MTEERTCSFERPSGEHRRLMIKAVCWPIKTMQPATQKHSAVIRHLGKVRHDVKKVMPVCRIEPAIQAIFAKAWKDI